MNKDKDNRVLSVVLPDGKILETIYDHEKHETNLVVSSDEGIKIFNSYTDPATGAEYLPFSENHGLVKSRFVRLPSGVGNYQDIRTTYLEIKDFISEFVELPESFKVISSIYVLLSWVYDQFETLPYIRVIGDYGTGKSHFMKTMTYLCYKAMLCSTVSNATIYRTLNETRGTLALDEANFKSSEMYSEIIKVLNSGHVSGTPVAKMKPIGKTGDYETDVFDVFGPKIIASRERFSDEALESRCLTQVLLPKDDLKVSSHFPKDFERRATSVRNDLLAFRLNALPYITVDEATLAGLKFPRLRQGALSITSLAFMIGSDVHGEVIKFLSDYERELQLVRKSDTKADVINCILELVGFDQGLVAGGDKSKDRGKIYLKQISDEFDRRFYEDYSEAKDKYVESGDDVIVYHQKTISPKKIGRHARNSGIKTDRDGGGFYIPILQELRTIEAIARRFGFEMPKVQPKLPIDETVSEINPDDIKF